jgi:hypothetical protein
LKVGYCTDISAISRHAQAASFLVAKAVIDPGPGDWDGAGDDQVLFLDDEGAGDDVHGSGDQAVS